MLKQRTLKHNLKIKALQTRNKRLLKININPQEVVEQLKKMNYLSEAAGNVITVFLFVFLIILNI